MASPTSSRPSWQRNRVFKFFASLELAVVLLALLLVATLAVSALSRWPWKKHHVAFLVTHLGIITLLFGSLIGRIWGIEGTMTIFKGDPASNRLLIDQHQLRV